MNYENLRNNDIFKNENNAINENNEEIINYIFNIIIPYIKSFKNKFSFYVINEGNNLNENDEMDKIILDEVIDKCYKDNKIINKISNEDINSILNKYFIYLLDENDYNQFNSLINLLFNHFINYIDTDKNYLINCLIFFKFNSNRILLIIEILKILLNHYNLENISIWIKENIKYLIKENNSFITVLDLCIKLIIHIFFSIKQEEYLNYIQTIKEIIQNIIKFESKFLFVSKTIHSLLLLMKIIILFKNDINLEKYDISKIIKLIKEDIYIILTNNLNNDKIDKLIKNLEDEYQLFKSILNKENFSKIMIYILEKKLILLSNERVEKKILDLILRSEDLIYIQKLFYIIYLKKE